MTNKKHTIVAALIAAALTPQAAKADLSGSLENNVTSNYVYRGQVLDSNPVLVPKLSLQLPLLTGGTLQLSTEQVLGTKGSTFYRGQYNVGLSLNTGRFKLTPGYQVVAYPGRDAANTQSVTARVEVDDSGLFPVKLNPALSVEKDIDPKGGYSYEGSVAPGKKFGKLDVSTPVALGVASKGYYSNSNDDTHYAYASVGLSSVYHATDRLALKAGVTYYNTSKRLSNASDNFVSATAGVAVAF